MLDKTIKNDVESQAMIDSHLRLLELTCVLGGSLIWTFRILNICSCFLQAGAVEKNKTNI